MEKMFNFGDKVVITDSNLKSYGKKGLFVGINSKGQGKVYLETPIVTGKTVISCVTIALEKISSYEKIDTDVLKEKADELTFESQQLTTRLKVIEDELTLIKREILFRNM